MFYIIYKVTNKVNGKFYIGKHQTEKLNDNYLGSGSILMKAIRRYGCASFEKEILYIYDNEKDMNEKEKEIVTEKFIADDNNYNMGIGGEGGPHFRGHKHMTETKAKISASKPRQTLTPEGRLKIIESNRTRKISIETRKKLSNRQKESYANTNRRKRLSESIKKHWIKRKALKGEIIMKQESIEKRIKSVKKSLKEAVGYSERTRLHILLEKLEKEKNEREEANKSKKIRKRKDRTNKVSKRKNDSDR